MYNTVLIRREVRTVGTFLLYFCISLCKDTFKYLFVKGDTPPIRIPVTSWEVQLSFDAHHKCFDLEVTGVILENTYLPYVRTVFYEKIVRADDATANYCP